MRTRWLSLVLLGLACGAESSTPAPMDPTMTPGQTALVVRVTYSESNIVALHVTGVALKRNRSFGPFDATGASVVQSGATIALLFDPADTGSAMVCVEARNGEGDVKASACGMFGVRANEVVRVDLPLMSAP